VKPDKVNEASLNEASVNQASLNEAKFNQARRRAELGWTLWGTAALAVVLAGGSSLALATGGKEPRLGEAVGFAAAVCLFGAFGGWIVARWPVRNPAIAVAKGLGAVTLRIFLPLVALGWLQSGGGWLRAAGADRFLLFFYLALLATDIVLHIIGSRNSPGSSGEKMAN
jgi:hypothetical protein